jgi:hypothetical protein
MKGGRSGFTELRRLLDAWLKHQDAPWGYADLAPLENEEFQNYVSDITDEGIYQEFIPFEPKDHWFRKLRNYREHYDQSGLVLLPVHLERAYEILAERRVIGKEDVNKFRKKLINWYGKQLRSLLEGSGLHVQNRNPEELAVRTDLYKNIIDFYIKDDKYTPYFIEAVNHIEAMKAKIKLGIPSYRFNPHLDKYDMSEEDRIETQEWTDKNIIRSLVATYTAYLLDNFGEEKFLREKEQISNALRQATDLFKTGKYPK